MDQELQTSINEELKYEPSVKANDVVVTVSNGTVRLSGEVSTLPEKLAANRSAMRVRGVKAVANEMTVRHPGNTDVDIAEIANKMLTWAADVPSESVKADVSGHVITLSGTVAWQYQRDAATRAVMNLRGVTAVTNQIALAHPASAGPARSSIAAAFSRNALLNPDSINVEIVGNQLVLRGKVRSFAEARQAERTAWAAEGVTSVRNDLVITS